MMNQYNSLAILLAIAVITLVSDAHSPQKIVGGQKTVLGQFPYQVSLRMWGWHFCGGSIIGNRHVLTAKHCIVDLTYPYTGLEVATGTVELYLGTLHTVKSIHYYDSSEFHDIAIIELNNDIEFKNHEKAVTLATNFINVGATANVTGWGYLSLSLPQTSQHLMKLTVTITTPNNPYSSMIYAIGGYETGTCHEDSGGPLVRNNELVGIVSGGEPCATAIADEYINVYYYKNWITEVMERK